MREIIIIILIIIIAIKTLYGAIYSDARLTKKDIFIILLVGVIIGEMTLNELIFGEASIYSSATDFFFRGVILIFH